jgi:hypothetical protein
LACIVQELKERKGNGEEGLRKICMEMYAREKLQSVLYREGKRYVCRISETKLGEGVGENLLKTGKTYMITGGCGGLGLLFARYLAKTYAVKLILIGRSPMDEEKEQKIKSLEALGSRVVYIQADVCDREAMKQELKKAVKDLGKIHGVLHAAGIAGSVSIFEQTIEGFRKVIDPKIEGTIALDEVLQDQPLDFIHYFSSAAAIIGDNGSCDYAVGNRFQTAYAHYRNDCWKRGKKPGKASVINWTYWQDGGMKFADDKLLDSFKSSGQQPIESTEGIAFFEKILSQNITQQMIFSGQRSRTEYLIGFSKGKPLKSLNRPFNQRICQLN